MGINEEANNTQDTRQFGYYLTSNPFLHTYLADAGIMPDITESNLSGRTTWHYKASDDLRRLVYNFRQQDGGEGHGTKQHKTASSGMGEAFSSCSGYAEE